MIPATAAAMLVRRARAHLVGLAALAATAWAVAAGAAVRALCELALRGLLQAPAIPGLIPLARCLHWLRETPGVVLVGALTLLALAWRWRHHAVIARVALWIEERDERLAYALVTRLDPRYAADRRLESLDARIAAVHLNPMLRAQAGHQVPQALLAMLIACAVALVSEVDPHALPGSTSRSAAAVAVQPNRLVGLRAELTPPAYTGWRSERFEDPDAIAGIVGSAVVVVGRGGTHGISATLGGVPLALREVGDTWRVHLTLPDSAALLTLYDREYRRDLVLDPRADRPPQVQIRLPAKDTTLRQIPATLTLDAEALDDVGLTRIAFEYIVSSGDGEGNFTSRGGVLGPRALDGVLQQRHRLTVPYRLLGLKEGEQLSLRAVALDGNTLSGPGKGLSETRTIRIARRSEFDTISVRAAPPSADTAMISLRMLIIAVERLDSARPSLARERYVDSAQTLANVSDRIRRRIEVIVDQVSDGGQVEPDSLWFIVLDAMWEGTRSLQIAETAEALPPLRLAYEALRQLRDARRHYLRGSLPPVIVNVERVRMTGSDSSRATPRQPGAPAAHLARRQRLRLALAGVALTLREGWRDDAVATLSELRIDALREDPALASALGLVIEQLRRGEDAAVALRDARRRAGSVRAEIPDLRPWSLLWP